MPFRISSFYSIIYHLKDGNTPGLNHLDMGEGAKPCFEAELSLGCFGLVLFFDASQLPVTPA